MQFLSGIKSLSASYDHFILDIWGVIHDGSVVYPGVVEVIRFLREQNKKIYFLSNAPRRAAKVSAVLARFGITPDLYDFILTSGEATFLDLQQRNLGKKYFYIGPNKDIDLLHGLDYQLVTDISQASFVIATGFDNDDSVLAEKMPQLLAAKKADLPLICVNPDLIVVRQNGNEMICAGILAQEYEKLGGVVSYYGKPFLDVYEMLLRIFGISSKNRILAIGDGLETDIKGAVDFGIDSVLVTSGILKSPDQAKLETICNSLRIFPNFVIPYLKL
ncbi:MAG: TIGR01459 family HAD-type hydrolase [Alphaproteobacteria bacterium]|nr:TIGR01459 family HAD-type hydrolase [Alphaproteobacteria bacterium]